VEPPGAVVVPEMMVWVAADADGDLRVVHGACVDWHTRNPGNKKPPIPIRKRRLRRGEIFVQRIFPRCASKGTRLSATVGFLRPRLAALVSQCVPDVRWSTANLTGPGKGRECHKINSGSGVLGGLCRRADSKLDVRRVLPKACFAENDAPGDRSICC
jgi:hypothetical protein